MQSSAIIQTDSLVEEKEGLEMTKTRKIGKKLLRLLINAALLVGVLLLCTWFSLDREETVFVLAAYLVLRLILWLLGKIVKGIKHSLEERRERARANPAVVKRKRGGLLRTAAILLAGLLLLCGAAAIKCYMEIPDALLELKDKYPETAEFVNAYPWKKNKDFDMDVSGEVSKGSIPLFIQWDERWGYKSYGSNFFAVNACGPTSLSMVICGLTGNTDANPYQVARYSETMGYYIPGEGTSWDLMTKGAESYGLSVETGEPSADYILGALSCGKVLICSMWPGDFTTSGHFIVLTGLDVQGNITLNDPNSIEKSEKSWTMDVLLPQIRAAWSYTY